MKLLKYILSVFLVMVCLIACNEDLQVNKKFEFTVSHLPVPKKIKPGETIEIRCQINTESNYTGTKYYLRYFQYEGKGILKLDNGTEFLPNDSYELPQKQFRLYYTSHSDQQHDFEVVFYNNSGQEQLMEFTFNSDNSEED